LFSDDFEEVLEYQIALNSFSIDLFSGGVKLLTVNPEGNGIKWENSRFYYGTQIENERQAIQDEIKKCQIC